MRNFRPSPVVNVSPTLQFGTMVLKLAELVAVRVVQAVVEAGHSVDLDSA